MYNDTCNRGFVAFKLEVYLEKVANDDRNTARRPMHRSDDTDIFLLHRSDQQLNI